jgi:hypothetical protein
MIRSCIRQAVRVFAGAAFFSCALAATAGSITLSDTNCDSFSLTGSPGNQTLTCVVSNAPTGCSIQGSTTGTNGGTVPLTALCSTGSPTTFAWSGGNCAGLTTQSCAASDSNKTVNYSVVISNAIGPGSPNPATKSVLWSASLPNKPSGCSISADVNPLPAGGGTVHLTASCTGGDSVDTWTWTGPTSSSSGNTATASITATSSFGVTANNGGGNGTASLTVNVTGGGGGGQISCSGYLGTSVMTLNMPLDTNRTLQMGALDAAVVQFTPTSLSSGSHVSLSTAGNQAGTHHDYTLSDTSCDFGPGKKQFVDAGAPNFRFSVTQTGGTGLNLKLGQTYYINIRNTDGLSGCAAQGATCDLYPVSMYPN